MHVPVTTTIAGAVQRVAGPGARGFYLEPLTNAVTGNPARWPVTVRLNGNEATQCPVGDGRARYVDGGLSAIDLVGGTVGDRWRVVFLEGAGDGIGGGMADTTWPTVIAKLTSWTGLSVSTSYWLTGAGGETGAVYSSAPMAALDVSGYAHLMLDAYYEGPGALTVNLRLSGGGPPAYMVSSGPLADAQEFHAVVGPGLATVAGVTVVPIRAPYAEVIFAFTGGAPSDLVISLTGMR